MRRREFVAGLKGESVAFPLATRAQQPKQMPLVGVLQDLAESEPVARSEVIAFREVLASAMYSRNSRIDSARKTDPSSTSSLFVWILMFVRPHAGERQ
jgi:hypothetical protein